MSEGYFTTSEGRNIYYADIDHAIDVLHPRMRNEHMYDQLKVLGLFDTFLESETPCGLPRTFTGCATGMLKVAA